MKYIFITTFLLTITFSGLSQDKFATWKTLEDVTYEKTTDEYGEIFVPKFGDKVKKLENQEVSLTGYIIPFEGMFKPDHIIISSLPIASCFFCGTGGPETVAEVYLEEPVKYTAKLVQVKGKLVLNDTDTNQLMYILENAELITD